MEKLVKQINEEINKHREFSKLTELEYLEEFFLTYKNDDLLSVGDLSLSQFLTANLLVNKIDMPFEEVLDCANIFVDAIEDEHDLDRICEYISLVETFIKEGNLDQVFAYVEKYGQFFNTFKLAGSKDIEYNIKQFILDSLSWFPDDEKQTLNIRICKEKLNKVIALFRNAKTTQPFYQLISFMILKRTVYKKTSVMYLRNLKRKERNKRIDDFVKKTDFETYEDVYKSLEQITKYYKNLVEKKTMHDKSLSRNKKYNQELLKLLNRIADDRLITAEDKILNLCTTPEIKISLLAFINKHNLKIYKQTLEINQQYKNSSLNQLELLFTKNNFKFTRLSVENQDILINNGNLEQISSILEFLSKNNFGFIKENHPIFIELLLYSNTDILNNINNLVNNGIITNEFIQNNPTILISECLKNELSYEKFMKKILFLRNKNINILNLISSNPEIFELSLQQIQIQLEIIKKYDLNLIHGNFEILSDLSLLDLVDNYIELGLGDYIKNNSQLISASKSSVIDRIIISYKLGINIFNENHRITTKISNPNKFYIPEDKLKNFIINYSTNYIDLKYKNVLDNNKRNVISNDYSELLELLKQFEIDELTYKFGNTLISKHRLLRNLEAILSNEELKKEDVVTILFQAALYKSLIVGEENEITDIYNILTSLPKINLSSKMKQINE